MMHYYKGVWCEALELKGDEPFLLWGMSSFSTFIWEKGLCAPDLHYKRIVSGAKYLNMKVPTYNDFLITLNEIQKKAKELNVFAQIRLSWVQLKNGCLFWIRLEPYLEPVSDKKVLPKRLSTLTLSEEESINPSRQCKIGNYGHHRKSFALGVNVDDVVLISRGGVVEATMASIVGLGASKVYVSDSKNRLDSIAEAQLLSFLKYKYEVVSGVLEEDLTRDDSLRWYYCNSVQGVVPISEINAVKKPENEKELKFLKEIAFFSKKHIKTLGTSSQLSIIDLTEVARD
jgi:branched-subunit amino acid aminotransferase/4-amino-4-deoxychorismate lyase